MITAGAICLGLVLGVLFVQRTAARTALRARTAAALVLAALALGATTAWVVGLSAGLALLVATALGYLLRRSIDE